VLPAALDDQIPVVAVQVGNATGDHFILDTGADLGYVFPHFYKAHPDDIKDQGFGHALQEYLPEMTAEGVGGEFFIAPTQVRAFNVGGVNFSEWLMFETNGLFDDDFYDGLIGYDFLRYFDVVFDHRDSMIYLEPNKLFKQAVAHPRG
jgi:hypothetical protein